jgi:SAM-dependent methyltransferase
MSDPAGDKGSCPGDDVGALYKRDFWCEENLKYSRPHYRLEKAARLINRLARGQERTLLDVGCGPATLMSLLEPNIQYHGIDIAIHESAPNLIESDFLEEPMQFKGQRFDIVVAQGVFEYVGKMQSLKFAEIAQLLDKDGIFFVSYVNFDHRHRSVHWLYSNVQPFKDFRGSIAEHFKILRLFPTSYNWNHSEPNRKLVRSANMHLNVSIPIISRVLAVEYFLICSARE